jgi:hypothetical protein
LDCGDNLDVLLHRQQTTVQLSYFPVSAISDNFLTICIYARCFSLKIENCCPKTHTHFFVIPIFGVLSFLAEEWRFLFHDTVWMGELVPTFRTNIIPSSSSIRLLLRPLDLQAVCITFRWNVRASHSVDWPPLFHERIRRLLSPSHCST